jgi:CMP-N-acetylneuraminic acid synthetase
MIYYLIPARSGSKGWPDKNRKLFSVTADLLIDHGFDVIVSTDDHEIMRMAKNRGFSVIMRPDELATETADMLGVIKHVAEKANLLGNDFIVLLYLTSPGRTMKDIADAFQLLRKSGASSLVCRTLAKTSPYMCVHEDGRPVITHNYYRRQDYPKCYEIRHHVAIYKVSEIYKLNKQLFNRATAWMDIPDPIDVDTVGDYKKEFKTEN